MYELFILSKLMHRPMHGYLIQSILNSAIGPVRRMSWGTLYPLMKRLEENGYILAVEEAKDDPRGKKRYLTTDKGRIRFLELMNEPSEPNANSADLFRIKVGCFGHLDSKAQKRIVKDYRSSLVQVVSHSESMTERVTGETNLSAHERRFALLALDHQKAVAESEIRWLDSVFQNLAPAGSSHAGPAPRRKRRP